MGFIDQYKGVRLRIRVFDHGLHITTAEIKDRGQRYIVLTVQKKTLGIFGEDTKLAFMINPVIPPKIFGNFIQEYDFDIKDSVPLADLLDFTPELVYEINDNYKIINAIRKNQDTTQDADFSPLSDPVPQESEGETKDQINIPAVSAIVEKPSKMADLKKDLLKDAKIIKSGITIAKKLTDTILQLKDLPEGNEKKELVRRTLDICATYPKLLYWLPRYLQIDTEVHAIVSQTYIRRVGIHPSYYVNEVNSRISEKILARPAQKQGWESVVLILGVLGIVTALIICCVWFLTHAK